MELENHIKPEILFVSSYPPRECGIATYTQDLINAINEKFHQSFSLKVCVLENDRPHRLYGSDVKYILHTSDYPRYLEIAEKINKDKNIKLVFLQHEFGLFSGDCGENVLPFLHAITKPILASFHTVLPDPGEKRRNIVQALASVINMIIVMTKKSAEILVKEYAVPEEKISIIYHGTHLIGYVESATEMKVSTEDNYVLSTFGLLNSGKCIETALEALPAVIAKFPKVMYLIIGRTHPEVIRQEGEKYREFLKMRIRELKIKKHVKFINNYLVLDELLEYLRHTDVYLFTSKDPHQAVSGTFSYAMGCSCPIISTPIPHAKEMLNDNCGVIIDFHNSEQLADAIIELLSDPLKRKRMSLNALHKIQPTSWQNSAIAHVNLFQKIMGTKQTLIYSIPEISLDHIKRLTTKTGIVQFSEICRPDLDSGFTLDDNARALIALIGCYEITPQPAITKLIDIYLNFIKFSQQQDGRFLNFVDRDGKYHEKNNYVNLEDSMGRAIWALGEFISKGFLLHDYFTNRAENILKKSLNCIQEFESPRAIAFSIKGLYYYNKVRQDSRVKEIISELADKLILKYNITFDSAWQWFENYLTYANSVLPESLLCAYLATGRKMYREIAKLSFDFLLSITFRENRIKVISNRGWHKRGGEIIQFGEQPIDVSYCILSLSLFYEEFKEDNYLDKIHIAFSWFHGNNHLHQIIYNPATGGCQDGLEEHNVNLNEGAESTVCYLMARLVMEKYIRPENRKRNDELYDEPILAGLVEGQGLPVYNHSADGSG